MSKLTISEGKLLEIDSFIDLVTEIEQGFFATIYANGPSFLMKTLILPTDGDWLVQESDQLKPTSEYVMRAIDIAANEGSGLLFVHTHPGRLHPPRLSPIDELSLRKLGESVIDILDNVFLVGVIGRRGWFVAVLSGDDFVKLNTVAVLGDGYKLLNEVNNFESSELDDRQFRTLGPINDTIRALTIAVVGAGGLGSAVSEQLVRMGVKKLLLVDDDVIDTPSNLRRIYGAKMSDIDTEEPKTKVFVVSEHLKRIGLASDIQPIFGNITDKLILQQLYEADVIFCATDTHGSRAALNSLPYLFNIPVIDIGVRVASTKSGPAGFFSAVRIFTPNSVCFLCRGIVDPERVRLEKLNESEVQSLKKEGYIPGEYDQPQPSIISLTTLAASLGTSAFINLLIDTEERYKDLTFETLEGYTTLGNNYRKRPECIYCAN